MRDNNIRKFQIIFMVPGKQAEMSDIRGPSFFGCITDECVFRVFIEIFLMNCIISADFKESGIKLE